MKVKVQKLGKKEKKKSTKKKKTKHAQTSELGKPKPRKELSESQIAEIKEAFSIFDCNGNGTISASEIKSVLKSIEKEPTDEEIHRLLREANKSGTGELTYLEFQEMMRNQLLIDDEPEDVKHVFQIFDPKSKGYMDTEEFRRVLTTIGEVLTEEEVNEILSVVDRESTGKIPFNDFVKRMCS